VLKDIRAHLSLALRSGFLRNVGVLVGGTAFAQVLTVLTLPILTRLYSPDDFAVLAVYTSILGIFAGIACLRLEIAIPIPEHDEDAANLLCLALISPFIVSCFLVLIILVCEDQLIAMIGQPALRSYIWLVPLGVWLSGAYSALQYWSTRQKRFSLIARTRLNQAVSSTGVQLYCGWTGLGPVGLLLGQLINSGAGVIKLGADIWRNQREPLTAVRPIGVLKTLRAYDRFPKYSTLEALANGASIQLPVLIIAAIAVGPEAGFLILATRIMTAPMGLVGGAISQVYLSRAPEERRKGHLTGFTSTIFRGLIKAGVGPILFIGGLAPFAFPVVFGVEWSRAGEIVSWMTPWFLLQFLTSPVSMILHITENQRIAFALQVAGLLVRTGMVLGAAYAMPKYIVEAYAVSGAVFYLIYLLCVLRIGGIGVKSFGFTLLGCWKVVFSWLIAAFLLASISSIK